MESPALFTTTILWCLWQLFTEWVEEEVLAMLHLCPWPTQSLLLSYLGQLRLDEPGQWQNCHSQEHLLAILATQDTLDTLDILDILDILDTLATLATLDTISTTATLPLPLTPWSPGTEGLCMRAWLAWDTPS